MLTFYRHEVIDVRFQALAALTKLARNFVGRQTIVDAGALPEFVRLLSSSDPRVLKYSSIALRNIASQDSLVTSVIDAGSARPLVQLLRCVSVLMCNSGCLTFTGMKSLMFTAQHLLHLTILVAILRQLLMLVHSRSSSACSRRPTLRFSNIRQWRFATSLCRTLW